MFKKVIHLDVG